MGLSKQYQRKAVTKRIIASVRKMLHGEKKPMSKSSYLPIDKKNSKLHRNSPMRI